MQHYNKFKKSFKNTQKIQNHQICYKITKLQNSYNILISPLMNSIIIGINSLKMIKNH